MKISIVINTLNRAKDLDRTLSALYYLDGPDFEVIVVNGPSTDVTQTVLEKYQKDIKIANCPVANISVSRNIGIAMASGDYVAFIDDDAVPEPDWLSRLMTGFTDSDVAAVGSDVYNPTGKEYQIRKVISNRYGSLASKAFDFPYSMQFTGVIGCNCIFDKKKLLSVGGYNEQYDYFLDETEVCVRLVDAGFRINYIPGACVHHKFSPSALRNCSRVVTDWTKIVKNTVYFCKTYLPSLIGEEGLKLHIQNFINDRKRDNRHNLYSHNFTKTDYEKASKSIETGLEQGKKDFARGYDLLITDKTLKKYACSYKPFPTFAIKTTNKLLNIVYLSEDYPPNLKGGVARFIHSLAVGMAEKGHHVHVITRTTADFDTIDFEEGVWVHRITIKDYPEQLLNRLPFYSPVYNHNILNKPYSFYQELLNIHQKYPVDFVHTSLFNCLNYYAALDERFKNVVTLVTPFINVFGGIYPRPAEYQFAIDLEEDMLKRISYIHADSNAIIDEINKSYPSIIDGKTTVAYLGIEDHDPEKIKEKESIEILFVGRLEYRKGIDVLLNCIPKLCQQYPQITFRLIGDKTIKIPGSNLTYQEQFLKNSKNKKYLNNVKFEGYLSDEELFDAYANCDIFVSPSRYESFGLIFLEAMIFAKPVIGCAAGAMPEVILNGITGLLAEPGDANSLACCLEQLCKNKILREKLGNAGRQRYEKYFTKKIMVDNILRYYYNILRKNEKNTQKNAKQQIVYNNHR